MRRICDVDRFFYDFRWQLLSDGSDIAKKLKVDNFNSAATACDDPCDEIFRYRWSAMACGFN
jgi:hypothetical protein